MSFQIFNFDVSTFWDLYIGNNYRIHTLPTVPNQPQHNPNPNNMILIIAEYSIVIPVPKSCHVVASKYVEK
jgi:hypothetical protein